MKISHQLSLIQSTIKNAIFQAQSILRASQDAGRLEAEILLAHVLQKNRAYLKTWPEQELTTEQQQHYQHLVHQRSQGIPIAYILGHKEFWSMTLQVSEATLIPRPETEHLVELALAKIPPDRYYTIADLGCGCGAVALAIAKERPLCLIIATDMSADALQIAKLNAANLSVDNISFARTNWLTGFANTCFDFIVSNPPYIARDDAHLLQGDLRFEPESALCSGKSGLEDLKMIAKQSRLCLKPCGWLLLEHGFQQGSAVTRILQQNLFENVTCYTDLADHERISVGQCSQAETQTSTPNLL